MKYDYQLKDGDAGVDDTVCIMRKYISKYSKNPEIVKIAKDLKGSNDAYSIKNCFNYVVRKISYEKDPPTTELVKSPKHTILGNSNYGDCDDLTVALGSLLMALGFTVVVKTINWKPGTDAMSHVYLLVSYEDGYIPMDPTMGYRGFGNEVKNIKRANLYKVMKNETCRIR